MAIKKKVRPETPKHDGIAKSKDKSEYTMNRSVKFGDLVYKRGEKVSFNDPFTRKVFLTNNYCS